MTVWLKLTLMGIVFPALYPPLALEDVTDRTDGALPSITKALLAPNDPDVPGVGNVKSAVFPTASFIVPPFRL